MYSSTLSLTSALGGSGWSKPRPERFTPGKETLHQFNRRLGGPQAGFGQLRNALPCPHRYVNLDSLARNEPTNMEYWWKPHILGENPVPVPLFSPQIPHGLTYDRTRSSADRSLNSDMIPKPLSDAGVLNTSEMAIHLSY
jgi:hypothetical protein